MQEQGHAVRKAAEQAKAALPKLNIHSHVANPNQILMRQPLKADAHSRASAVVGFMPIFLVAAVLTRPGYRTMVRIGHIPC
jgi:hypothetical protein